MFLYTIFNIVVTIVFLIALGYIAFRLFARWQGDENIVFGVKKRTPFIVEDITFGQMVLSCDVPFRNQGKQNGTIMDAFPRALLPQEQFDNVRVETWLTSVKEPRHDGYWKAEIITPGAGGTVRIYVILTAKSGNIRNDLKGFPNMNLDIVYQMVGRSDWNIRKARITVKAEEVARALEL